MVSKNIPKEMPPNVTWLKASAIKDSLRTTINAPINGAINNKQTANQRISNKIKI